MLYRRIQKELENLSLPKTINRIEQEVNATYNNIIADLRDNLNSLKEDDFIFSVLSKGRILPSYNLHCMQNKFIKFLCKEENV